MTKYISIPLEEIDHKIDYLEKKIQKLKENNLLSHDFYRLQGMQAELFALKITSEIYEK